MVEELCHVMQETGLKRPNSGKDDDDDDGIDFKCSGSHKYLYDRNMQDQAHNAVTALLPSITRGFFYLCT
jgi:hypothetical protein